MHGQPSKRTDSRRPVSVTPRPIDVRCVGASAETNTTEWSLNVHFAQRSMSAVKLCLTTAVLGLLLLCAPGAQAFVPGEAQVLASSPVPLTSVAVDPHTSLIYALEYQGTKAFRFDPSSNAWTEIAEAPINIGNNGGATYLNGKIYSSSTGNGEFLEVYDIASNTWSTIPSPLGKGTADITQVGGELYLVDETSFVKYDPATEVTTPLANAPSFTGGCTEGFERWGGLQPYQGKIYGHQGDGCRGFAVYDIPSNTWTELPETPLEGGATEGPVAGSALDPVSGTYFAYGGYGGNVLFEYSIATNNWTTFTLPFNVDDGGLAYVTLAGLRGIYAIQGQRGNEFVRYVTAEPSADLSVTSAASTPNVTVGGTFTYTTKVTNGGPNETGNVALSDSLPANVALVSVTASQGSCSGTSKVICSLGSLANQGTATVILVVKASTAGTATSTAAVSGEAPDPNPANNSTTATSTITAVSTTPTTGVSKAVPTPVAQCVSSRAETIHWKTLQGVHLVSVVITLNGKLYSRLSGRARSADVSLKGAGVGQVLVEITGKTKSGKTYTNQRVYHPCQPGHGAGPSRSLYLRLHKTKV